MVLPKGGHDQVPEFRIPPEYEIRSYQDGDDIEWKRIQTKAVGHKRENLDKWWPAYQEVLLDGGLFFVEHTPTGNLVATAGAILYDYGGVFPNGGAPGWVATLPDHRRQGLSFALACCAVHKLVKEKVENIFLTTDDEFLEAIQMYYKFGFRPCRYVEGIEERWKQLCSLTRIPFTPETWLTPEEFNNANKAIDSANS